MPVIPDFLAAARAGDFEALLAVLDPDVVLRVDRGALPWAASREVRGARAVVEQARTFARLAGFARPALVNGAAGFVVAPRGRPVAVAGFTVAHGKIVEIDLLADPARLRELDLTVLDADALSQDASTALLIAVPKSSAPLRAERNASGAISLPGPWPSRTL